MSQTLLEEARYYSVTTHYPQEARSLLARLAAHIDALESMASPVTCFNCKRTIARADDWYRCFDCSMSLCRDCTQQHFGSAYSAHHKTMESYEHALKGEAAAYARGCADGARAERERCARIAEELEVQFVSYYDEESGYWRTKGPSLRALIAAAIRSSEPPSNERQQAVDQGEG